MVLFEFCLLLLEIFDIIVIGESLARHEVDPFLCITELSNCFDPILRVANCKDAVGCDTCRKR